MNLTPTERRDIERITDLGKLLTVLLIMIRLDRPVTIQDIQRVAQINYETAASHLRQLARRHMITRTRAGYLLTPSARQLVLPVAENPRLAVSSSSSFKSLMETNTCIRLEAEEEKIKKLAENPRVVQNLAENPRDPEIPVTLLEAYQEAGISLNRRTLALAAKEWITAEYIRGHHAALTKRGKGNSTGLLITILESGEPAPAPEPDPDDPKRYVTGKYAKYIEH